MKVLPRYPVYVPSVSRWQPDRALTRKALQRDEIPFRYVVEPHEASKYMPYLTERDSLCVLPFSRLGKGSVPARNWIRDHAEKYGYERHWILDDNLIEFRRLWKGRRIPCDAGLALRVVEDLSDRYENVGVSGLNYQMFVPADTPVPFYTNVHVYSCCLVASAMPYRWRGRLNEDTDLCLQALVNGWCTILVNAFMCNKLRTMALSGGNTDSLYGTGVEAEAYDGRDTMGRFEMARSLARTWPGLVKVSRRFDRYQHSVNWGRFAKDPALRLRPGIALDDLPNFDEYGMNLRAVRDVKSPALRKILDEGIQ